MKGHHYFYLIIFIILLTGCSFFHQNANESNQEDDTQQKLEQRKSKTEQLKPSDHNIQYLLTQSEGKFVGKNYHKENASQEFAQTITNTNALQQYVSLLTLAGNDYSKTYQFVKDFKAEVPKSTPTPTFQDEDGREVANKTNIEILLDASGSMNEVIDGEKKMDAAKRSIHQFVSELPQDVNITLRVYGHKGSESGATKEESCQSTEIIYPLGSYEENKFKTALNQVKPAGWTPIANAIQQAKEDLKDEEGSRNIVYIVSDGEETCDGDPVKAAADLHESGVQALINIIGFDVNNAGQKALKEIADAGNGKFTTVATGKDLTQFFEEEKNRLYFAWEHWYNENHYMAEHAYEQKYKQLNQQQIQVDQQIENEFTILYEICDETLNCDNEAKDLLHQRKNVIRNYIHIQITKHKADLKKATQQAQQKYRNQSITEKNKVIGE